MTSRFCQPTEICIRPTAFGVRLALNACIWLLAFSLVRTGFAQDKTADAAQMQLPKRDAELDTLLGNLGLVGLRTKHLEDALARAEKIQTDAQGTPPKSAPKPAAIAAQLAALYSRYLSEKLDQPEAQEEIFGRISELVKRYPAAETAELKILRQQTDYFAAQQKMDLWLQHPEETQSRDEAIALFEKVLPQLEGAQKTIAERYDALVLLYESADNGAIRLDAEAQMASARAISGRAAYFAAWTHYYLGLVSGDEKVRSDHFQAARTGFQNLLGIVVEADAKDALASYEKVKASQLELHLIWRARTLLGLGLAEAAIGNLKASDLCFRWLETGGTAAELLDQMNYWRMVALVHCGHWNEARRFATEKLAAMELPMTPGKLALAFAAFRHAFRKDVKQTAEQQQFESLATNTLIKLEEFAFLRKAIKDGLWNVNASAGFYPLWLSGQVKYLAAESTHKPEDFKAAEATIQAAIDKSEDVKDLGVVADARYRLAWCQYRQEKYVVSASNFEAASAELSTTDSNLAADAAWMGFTAWHRAAQTEKTYLSRATQCLVRLKQEFPDSAHATRAASYLAKFRPDNQTAEARLNTLENVVGEEELTSLSRAEQVSLRFDIWRNSLAKQVRHPEEAPKTELAAKELAIELLGLQARLQSHQEEAETLSPARSLDIARIALTLESSPAPELPGDKRIFNKIDANWWYESAGKLLKEVEQPLIKNEFHYRAALYTYGRGEFDLALDHARIAAAGDPLSPLTYPSAILAAKAADTLVDFTGESRNYLEQASACYDRLVELRDADEDTVKHNGNIRAALLRSAELKTKLRKFEQAEPLWLALLAAYPTDPDYLMAAAKVEQELGKHDSVMERTGRLLRGLPKGESRWLEAKAVQLESLRHTDAELAQKTWEQFKVLYPPEEVPEWEALFGTLAAKLTLGESQPQ